VHQDGAGAVQNPCLAPIVRRQGALRWSDQAGLSAAVSSVQPQARRYSLIID